MGFSIPPNVFGPGLSIAHPGTIIVNGYVSVGENCRIHNCAQLVTAAGSTNACPKIGNNVFIGPGAVIIGDIEIADGIVIGANSVVNKSFLEKGITIAGAPAKKISDKGSNRYYHRATDILRTGGPKPAELILSESKLNADNKNSDLYLVVRNIGNITWTKDILLRIGTAQEYDRPSAYYHPSWIAPNRICTFSENKITPHETATFNFTISTNCAIPSEKFQLVLENKRWLPKTEFEIQYKKNEAKTSIIA
jgi:Serine acetyltransferase